MSSLLKCHIKKLQCQITCEHCGKSVLNGSFLKKPFVFEHGIKEGFFICDICPKTVFSLETAYTALPADLFGVIGHFT